MQIHINRDGQDFGPYTLEQVNQYLQEGSIVPTDMAWHEGMPDWMPLPKVQGVQIPDDAELEVAGGGSKKTVLWISLAAVAAALVVGGIVFVVMNKGDKGTQAAQAGDSSGGGSSSGSTGGGATGGSSGGGMDNGMGMDGGMEMGMDNGMAMGMDGMAGGGADSGKVMALLEQKCFKCHGNGKSKGKYSLDSRDAALSAIKPGNPDGSLIMELIRRDDPDSAMPPKESDALTKAEIAMVAAWIKAGAKF